ncbi:exodeoxyribonuclease I [Coralloluteibacterium stylophorae]|uniref:Exodeoxyribonuclease I n=1 Tax=Coralloluteibacterium stylophorae TaxID=1776034 RepID=A0A8J7VRK2_9GAMM|nr:exodeoxyribonuclease I [Coralloluteibacterium stylophorae]MBS7455798.1 exodeoxyribonuclease I [Coralloluteibacterium stylophorae]
MTAPSFLWYDLETFGRDPRRTRIAQFAAIRTNADLEQAEAPVSLFCRPADDLLPSPGAAMITGLSPQRAQRDGLPEAEFVARIHEEMSRPGTCSLGYNSLRFDDEFVRHALYRNFFDPYEREWRGGNSRWDLLDFMRLAHALRPEGLEWPRREDGSPSFRLEELAAANGIGHSRAHEALSDVEALIGLARRLRAAQPRLWDYGLTLRSKKHCGGLVDVVHGEPLLHVSGRYPASRLCAALVLPIARHPAIDSRVIVADLDQPPDALLELDAGDIADRLYTPRADLPEGEARIGLKEVHLNRCPALVPIRHLREADYARLGIDPGVALARAARLRADADLPEKLRRVFARPPRGGGGDVDGALYDGFIPDADRARFARVRSAPPEALTADAFPFADPRFGELLFRYRARNWPESLDAAGRERWDAFRRGRLAPGSECSEYDFASYFAEIAAIRSAHPDGATQVLMDAYAEWGRRLQGDLAPSAPASPP